MKKKIFFYNHHQHGDLALSRGIVDWIVNNFTVDADFYYSTKMNPESVSFNDKVKVIGPEYHIRNTSMEDIIRDDGFENLSVVIGRGDTYSVSYDSIEENLTQDDFVFLNLWIGSSKNFMERDYAIFGGNTFPIDFNCENIFIQCCELIQKLSEHNINIPYPTSLIDVLPKANKNPKQKQKIDTFIDSISLFKNKVLICNGFVHSEQCYNFSFTSYLEDIANEFNDVAFIYTNKDRYFNFNEFCINDYCVLPNLNEIDYLSTKCDILITRRSGPGEIIQTYDNFFDEYKSILSFTYHPLSNFIFTDGTAQLEWTNDFSKNSVSNIVKKHISYKRNKKYD